MKKNKEKKHKVMRYDVFFFFFVSLHEFAIDKNKLLKFVWRTLKICIFLFCYYNEANDSKMLIGRFFVFLFSFFVLYEFYYGKMLVAGKIKDRWFFGIFFMAMSQKSHNNEISLCYFQ